MTQRLAICLTIVNLILLVGILVENRPLSAQGAPGVLRGSGLEIVDAQGRVRASIGILAESSTYPETVILRLIDRNLKPTVKLTTQEGMTGYPKGSGMGFLGASDATQAYIGAGGATSKVELKNNDGQRQLVTP